MPSLNQVQIAGHLSRDAELKYTANGTAVTEFTVAVNHDYKDKKEVAWIRVKAFGVWAEAAGQIKKGQAVMVIGRIATPEWEKDGKKQTRTEIVANSLYALPRGEPAPSASQAVRIAPGGNSGSPRATHDLSQNDDDSPVPF